MNIQKYDRQKMMHLFIDDASTDGTDHKIEEWLEQHPDNVVTYIHNNSRQGGTFNNFAGMRDAPEDAIVIELNGDDWLPDSGVLSFFNKLYSDGDIWMTYNTVRINGGPPAPWARPYSRDVVNSNSFRDQKEWSSSHLHTFRKKLFDHLDSNWQIDPETGTYWECADDQALYLSMLELAGEHALHINRITCTYNFHDSSHSYLDAGKSVVTAERIRKLPRYQPLRGL